MGKHQGEAIMALLAWILGIGLLWGGAKAFFVEEGVEPGRGAVTTDRSSDEEHPG